jgi:hypothetical protein
MRYHIEWEGTCHDDVNAILAKGPLGRELMQAFRLLANELEFDPHLKGRDVAEGLRSVDAMRLRAYYYIEHEAGLVKVVALRLPSA